MFEFSERDTRISANTFLETLEQVFAIDGRMTTTVFLQRQLVGLGSFFLADTPGIRRVSIHSCVRHPDQTGPGRGAPWRFIFLSTGAKLEGKVTLLIPRFENGNNHCPTIGIEVFTATGAFSPRPA